MSIRFISNTIAALLMAFAHITFVANAQAPTASGTAQPTATDQPHSAKPHQNPAFPAAFVFQSNSASYLAVDVPARNERHIASGS